MPTTPLFFEDIIRYLEEHLTEPIDVQKLARMANMSLYEFRRIFSFVTKIPLSEYIRKRRLSMAAMELRAGNASVTDLALKYGYETPSSFSRAFKEYHGRTPTEVSASTPVKMLTRVSVDLVICGGCDIVYSIQTDGAFAISGYHGVSPMTDTECCEDVWAEFYRSPCGKNLESSGAGQIYAAYQDGEEGVSCQIGVREDPSGRKGQFCLPAATWACFPMHPVADRAVNRFYHEILSQWLAVSAYERDPFLPNVEVFPADMSGDDFPWEIRIPVRKRT